MTGWVPFSHRYGIADKEAVVRWCESGGEDFQAEAWRCRHDPICSVIAGIVGDPEPIFRCTCPGSGGRRQCADRASQEDRLCDACREHCLAVDYVGRYHRLTGVYGRCGVTNLLREMWLQELWPTCRELSREERAEERIVAEVREAYLRHGDNAVESRGKAS